ncbi:MAG: hypothetical protein V7K64_31965 [Nostoc sp.]|uniref:hypothetical protein n=1 Tax=unclassified Nostoc TaxID=2593658 RepID=UPI0025E39B4B|nr:hypothetical protein [Nostoc sp. JL34]
MNLAIKTTPLTTTPKLIYDVLIENQQDGTVKAILLGLPDCEDLGNTETEAIEKLSQSLQTRLETAIAETTFLLKIYGLMAIVIICLPEVFRIS